MRTLTLRQKLNYYVIPALFLLPTISLALLISNFSHQLIQSANRLQEIRVQQIYDFCEEQQRILFSSGLEDAPFYVNAARQQVLEKIRALPKEEGQFIVLSHGSDLVSDQFVNDSALMDELGRVAYQKQASFTYTDANGAESYAVVHQVTPWGWILVSKLQRGEALLALSQTVFMLSAIMVMAFAAFLTYFFVVTKRLVSPFTQLITTVKAFGEGEFERRAECYGLYELDHLSQSFNQMADKISALSSLQEEKIKESSQELNLTLSALEVSNQQLLESEKLAALGRIVIGISHELNTPLGTSIVANSALAERFKVIKDQLTEKKGITEKEFSEFLTSGEEATRLLSASLARATALIDSFKRCSAQYHTEEKVEFRVKELAQTALSLSQKELVESNITPQILGPDELMATSYLGVLTLVLDALICNAIEHGLKFEPGELCISYFREQDKLILQVKDNGVGIAPDFKTSIFEPFTTANRGQSTGLGLYMVFNLIQHINGQVSCSSELGQGATFRVEVAGIF